MAPPSGSRATNRRGSNFDGVDMDRARDLVGRLHAGATEISQLIRQLWAGYQESRWTGPDSDRFRQRLTEFDRLMLRRVRELRDAAQNVEAIRRNQLIKSR